MQKKKFDAMVVDLSSLQSALLPNDNLSECNKEQEMKSMDPFERQAQELICLLTTIRTKVERLIELRKRLGSGKRTRDSIQLQLSNSEQLQSAILQWNQLKAVLAKKEKKLNEKEIAEKRQLLLLLKQDIKDLSYQNTSTSNIQIVQNEIKTVLNERELREQKHPQQKQAQQYESKYDYQSKRSSYDLYDSKRSELLFEQQVAVNMAKEDAILRQIGDELVQAKELAQYSNKQLRIQEHMLDQVENKVDHLNTRFSSVNRKLKNILEESGGMSRWCPILLCLIILLSLVGYIFNAF